MHLKSDRGFTQQGGSRPQECSFPRAEIRNRTTRVLYSECVSGSPDATQRTARTLAAVVAYALPWDALGEPGSLEDFNHLSDRLALRQPAGDARAGMVVKDRNQRAITAVSLGGRERTDIHRP